MATPATKPAAGRSRRAVGGRPWLLACAAGFLGLCALTRSFVADDAWITARYAANLAAGQGFAWNPGGPRVEGFSNPLLVAVETLARMAGLPSISAGRAVGVACGLALLALIHVEGRVVLGSAATRVALVLTALYPPLALWAVGGLETLPAAVAITGGVLALSRAQVRRRDAARAGAFFSLLPWLRPEGLVVALAVAMLAEGPGLIRRGNRRTAAVRLALAAGPPLASQIALEGLRLAVYHHVVPNSVLYKAAAGGVLDVLGRFAVQAAPVLLLGAAGLVAARGRQRLLAVPPAVYALGSLGTLDSANAFSRFLLPTWPQWALLAGIAVAAAGSRRPRSGATRRTTMAATLATALAVMGVVEVLAVRRFAGQYADCRQAARSEVADWLRANTPPGATLSVSDAGLVPARSGHRTAIDQFFLNDPLIQRTGPLSPGRRAELVLDRRPDALVLASRTRARFSGLYPTDALIAAHARRGGYALAHIAAGRDDDCGYSLFLYRRTA